MFKKKEIIDPIQKEYEYMDLLSRKLDLYNYVRSSFTRTTYAQFKTEFCLLSEEWMIKKILGNEFLEEYKRTVCMDKPKTCCESKKSSSLEEDAKPS